MKAKKKRDRPPQERRSQIPSRIFSAKTATNVPQANTSGYRKASDIQTCRGCGCTDANACDGGCFWVEPNVCSRCVTPEQANAFLSEYQQVRNWTRARRD
jgi:hypothetical protein